MPELTARHILEQGDCLATCTVDELEEEPGFRPTNTRAELRRARGPWPPPGEKILAVCRCANCGAPRARVSAGRVAGTRLIRTRPLPCQSCGFEGGR